MESNNEYHVLGTGGVCLIRQIESMKHQYFIKKIMEIFINIIVKMNNCQIFRVMTVIIAQKLDMHLFLK